MPILHGTLGYRILRAIAPAEPNQMNGAAYAERSKLEVLLGRDIWQRIKGKNVLDFGCGAGAEAIEIARRGARQVYGVDLSERWLEVGRRAASAANCKNVEFCTMTPEPVDVIVSVDAFEHFADPAAILQSMAGVLKPDGCVLA